ncbi:MAG: hypothetical protein OEU92_18580 [Alphaproteobacteria bacterium]|nr:hypothetical protein [Alphaproteobacteria bacterium]
MSETSRARPNPGHVQREVIASTALTRRQLLAGTGQVALLAILPIGCAPAANAPWADGTFWDDGLGWVDGADQFWSRSAAD